MTMPQGPRRSQTTPLHKTPPYDTTRRGPNYEQPTEASKAKIRDANSATRHDSNSPPSGQSSPTSEGSLSRSTSQKSTKPEKHSETVVHWQIAGWKAANGAAPVSGGILFMPGDNEESYVETSPLIHAPIHRRHSVILRARSKIFTDVSTEPDEIGEAYQEDLQRGGREQVPNEMNDDYMKSPTPSPFYGDSTEVIVEEQAPEDGQAEETYIKAAANGSKYRLQQELRVTAAGADLDVEIEPQIAVQKHDESTIHGNEELSGFTKPLSELYRLDLSPEESSQELATVNEIISQAQTIVSDIQKEASDLDNSFSALLTRVELGTQPQEERELLEQEKEKFRILEQKLERQQAEPSKDAERKIQDLTAENDSINRRVHELEAKFGGVQSEAEEHKINNERTECELASEKNLKLKRLYQDLVKRLQDSNEEQTKVLRAQLREKQQRIIKVLKWKAERTKLPQAQSEELDAQLQENAVMGEHMKSLQSQVTDLYKRLEKERKERRKEKAAYGKSLKLEQTVNEDLQSSIDRLRRNLKERFGQGLEHRINELEIDLRTTRGTNEQLQDEITAEYNRALQWKFEYELLREKCTCGAFVPPGARDKLTESLESEEFHRQQKRREQEEAEQKQAKTSEALGKLQELINDREAELAKTEFRNKELLERNKELEKALECGGFIKPKPPRRKYVRLREPTYKYPEQEAQRKLIVDDFRESLKPETELQREAHDFLERVRKWHMASVPATCYGLLAQAQLRNTDIHPKARPRSISRSRSRSITTKPVPTRHQSSDSISSTGTSASDIAIEQERKEKEKNEWYVQYPPSRDEYQKLKKVCAWKRWNVEGYLRRKGCSAEERERGWALEGLLKAKAA